MRVGRDRQTEGAVPPPGPPVVGVCGASGMTINTYLLLPFSVHWVQDDCNGHS